VTGLEGLGGDLIWIGLDFALGDVFEGVLLGVALGGILDGCWCVMNLETERIWNGRRGGLMLKYRREGDERGKCS
jgi:hypothetical protein